MQKIYKNFVTAYAPEEYYDDAQKFMVVSNIVFGINQGLSVKMGVNFMLFYMTLRTLGTKKHESFIRDTTLRKCK